MLAAGWLAFLTPRRRRSNVAARSWLATRLLLGTSIVIQYAASLSVPPTVWPADRRPWANVGRGWAPANDTCERLGVEDSGSTSGLACWMAIDGQQSSTLLLWDLMALGSLTLCSLCPLPKGSMPGVAMRKSTCSQRALCPLVCMPTHSMAAFLRRSRRTDDRQPRALGAAYVARCDPHSLLQSCVHRKYGRYTGSDERRLPLSLALVAFCGEKAGLFQRYALATATTIFMGSDAPQAPFPGSNHSVHMHGALLKK